MCEKKKKGGGREEASLSISITIVTSFYEWSMADGVNDTSLQPFTRKNKKEKRGSFQSTDTLL